MSGISLFAVMAVGILFMGLFVWLLVLVIRALRKYIRSVKRSAPAERPAR